MHRMSRALWTRFALPLLVAAALVVAAGGLYTFVFGNTEYLTRLDMADPAQGSIKAGLWFGRVILVGFVVGLFMTLYALCRGILWRHYSGYWKALDVWEEETLRLLSGKTDEGKVLERLTREVDAQSRVGIVLASWQDASPDSDAKLVLEGQATSNRHLLSSVHALASILVLIGLVGNFFGLAHAVKQLPELVSKPAQPVASPSTKATTTGHTEAVGSGGVTVTETTAQSEAVTESGPPADVMKDRITDLSAGLSVVVVSSVLGIGCMIILTLIVNMVKASFNTLVSAEIALMAAEIGPRLRPPTEKTFFDRLGKVLENIHEVPVKLADFTRDAGQFTRDLSKMATKMDALHKRMGSRVIEDVALAKQSYQEFRTSNEAFQRIILDEHALLELLLGNADSTGQKLQSIADAIAKLAAEMDRMHVTYGKHVQQLQTSAQENITSFTQGLQEMHNSYLETTTQCGAYLQLAQGALVNDRAQLERANQEIVTANIASQERIALTAQEAMERLAQQVGDTVREARQEELRALGAMIESVSSSLHQAEADTAREMTTASQRASQDMREAALASRHTLHHLLTELREFARQDQEMRIEQAKTLEVWRGSFRGVVQEFNKELLVDAGEEVKKVAEDGFRQMVSKLEAALLEKAKSSASSASAENNGNHGAATPSTTADKSSAPLRGKGGSHR